MSLRSIVSSLVAVTLGLMISLAPLEESHSQSPGLFSDGVEASQPSYVVVEGDTLWDISGKILGRPDFWPQVWALNPQIHNPHYIYPGDTISFVNSLEPLLSLSEVEIESAGGTFSPGTMELDEEAYDDDVADTEPLESDLFVETIDGDEGTADIESDLFGDLGGIPDIEVIRTKPIRRKTTVHRVFVGAFVTKSELAESGFVKAVQVGETLLGAGDSIFVELDDSNPGKLNDVFLTYRKAGQVRDPETGDDWGVMTELTGLIILGPKEGKSHQAKVVKSVLEIEPGQFITPMVQNPFQLIRELKSETAIQGRLIATQSTRNKYAEAGSVVFIDKGLSDGVKRGVTLDVLKRSSDRLSILEEKFSDPNQAVARLMVIDAKPDASSCLVLSSKREIEPGDSVVNSR